MTEQEEIRQFAKDHKELRLAPKPKGIPDLKKVILDKCSHFIEETDTMCGCGRDILLRISGTLMKECGQCGIERNKREYDNAVRFNLEKYRIKAELTAARNKEEKPKKASRGRFAQPVERRYPDYD